MLCCGAISGQFLRRFQASKKGLSLLSDLITKPCAIINRLANDRSAVVGYHRFLNNPRVCYHNIMEGHLDFVSKKTKGKHLICIQDTSEYCYEKHRGFIKEGTMGVISDDRSLGLRVHPMLVLDAEDEFMYGFSSFEIINRIDRRIDTSKHGYKDIPIEEKESHRWLSAIINTKSVLSEAESLTIVSDRESDIYQLWSRVPDNKTHLIIRSSLKRMFESEGKPLDPFNPSNFVGKTKILLSKEGNRKGREVELEVFIHQAWTKKPLALRRQGNKVDSEQIQLNVVVTREIVGTTTDPGHQRAEWILLTDIKTETLQDAELIISAYKSRWNIEQVFRLTKQKGFELEASQLETAHAIENLIALVFIAAVKVFQMVKSRADQERPATDVFDDTELTLITQLNGRLEGKTEKSRNKHKSGSLASAIWVIGRLGKWKPEDRDPPGPITLLRGLIALRHYMQINSILSG